MFSLRVLSTCVGKACNKLHQLVIVCWKKKSYFFAAIAVCSAIISFRVGIGAPSLRIVTNPRLGPFRLRQTVEFTCEVDLAPSENLIYQWQCCQATGFFRFVTDFGHKIPHPKIVCLLTELTIYLHSMSERFFRI